MLHLLILRYTKSAAAAGPHVPEHVEFLRRHHAEGTFVLSGQAVPAEAGGLVLATGLDRAGVEQVAASDPFVLAGVGSYEIITMTPGRVHPDLAQVLELPVVPDIGWDAESFAALSTGRQVLALLEPRAMEPVLQHAGKALLAALAANDAEAAGYARRCAGQLDERAWEGDTQLSLELRHALGEPAGPGEFGVPAWPLDDTAVDLADLADQLDGDAGQGNGVVDLRSGTVWPPGIMDYDPPAELDEESSDYDEDRFLYFTPESGEAYRDMLNFTDHVTSEQLRQRLLDALDGRGAFRRFRNIVHDGPPEVLTRWQIYRQERTLGRARAWLAGHGYRPRH